MSDQTNKGCCDEATLQKARECKSAEDCAALLKEAAGHPQAKAAGAVNWAAIMADLLPELSQAAMKALAQILAGLGA
jgi:hypothetical protein